MELRLFRGEHLGCISWGVVANINVCIQTDVYQCVSGDNFKGGDGLYYALNLYKCKCLMFTLMINFINAHKFVKMV